MKAKHRKLVPVDRLSTRIRWHDLDPRALARLIRIARAEDLAGAGFRAAPARRGDITTLAVVGRENGRAVLRAREAMVVCGLPLLAMILRQYASGVTTRIRTRDGSKVAAGTVLAELSGPARTMITAERVLLNFLQRLSGIATQTSRYVQALGPSRTRLLDTRKTTPGWRALEKYAVACGGGYNHRLGLYDRILIKDNHLAAAGATRGERLAAAVAQARRKAVGSIVAVEIDEVQQLAPVMEAGADVVLFDNFPPAALARAAPQARGRIRTEASGGIKLEHLPQLSRLGLDLVSTGALIHQSTWVDIGMDWY